MMSRCGIAGQYDDQIDYPVRLGHRPLGMVVDIDQQDCIENSHSST